MVRKSTCGKREGKSGTRVAETEEAISDEAYGSRARTFMERPIAMRATLRPTFPRPMIPSVLPETSVPTNLDLGGMV